jgi:acyl-CoA thioesterase I
MRVICALGLGLAIALASGACTDRQTAEPAAPVATAAPVAPVAAPAVPAKPRIVCLGDSLTAGYGVSSEDAYPAQLAVRARSAGLDYEVVNAGVSGDTSADGLRRVDWALDGNVEVLILALGANDGLRGLPPDQMKENLQRVITRARQRGIAVILAGMEAPPNFGDQYTSEFRAVFKDLASTNHLVFVPFLLEGVAGVAALNQADGIHPTARGAEKVAETLWPPLEKMIQTGQSR